MIFNKKWFLKNQKNLLKFANSSFGKGILCVEKDFGKIVGILPNAVFAKNGKQYTGDFRTHNKFAKRIYYAGLPLWKSLHWFDMNFANRFAPQFNLGFDTLTVYPDPGPTETNSVDGLVFWNAGEATWAAARNAAASDSAQDNTNPNQLARAFRFGAGDWRISRGFFLFDTSALTANANITVGVISFKDASGSTNNADTTDVDIVSSSPATNTALITGDFDEVGSTVFGSKALSAWTNDDSAYNDITLDSNGRANISKTGISKFGARIARDTDNAAPTGDNLVQCYYAEQTGTTKDPKLVVTFTVSTSGFLTIL